MAAARSASMSELLTSLRRMNAREVVERTRRDYDDVAELYDDMVRRGDEVTDSLSAAMINVSLVLSAPVDPTVLCSTPGAVRDRGPITWTATASGRTESISRRP